MNEWWRDSDVQQHVISRGNTYFLVSSSSKRFQELLNIVTVHLNITFYTCEYPGCNLVYFADTVDLNKRFITYCPSCTELDSKLQSDK